MAVWCASPPEFRPKDQVVSMVYHHPPEIIPGTTATIVAPHTGSLYAVQLPDGMLHRWFADFELQTISPHHSHCGLLKAGSLARIVSTEGHPKEIKPGTIVKIVKVVAQVPFYDVLLENKNYHRWMAGFEITSKSLVQDMD